ncbi:GntR family transcriptional regulator [Paenarthrobacter nicotinovorans]|uniref:GntR family transcriptional regulator n=1 Tax=Paenarthrobacter nicotinovorans TaxID=29320 RepID=UPI00380CD2B8
MDVKSLTVETHRRLRDEIVQGRIQPNERLVALHLAERYEVSRTPVREALQLLANEGLIVPAARGYFVREYTAEEIREIYEIRAALEGLAAKSAAERITEDQIRDLFRIGAHRRGDGLAGRESIVERNDAFHEAIMQASGNHRLAELHRTSSEHVFNYRIAGLYTDDEVEVALQEHSQILDAIARRDPASARDLAEAHVLGSLAITLSKLF